MKRELSRRDFLLLAGLGTSATLVQVHARRSGAGNRSASWINTFCGECPGGCALRVLAAGNRLIAAEPNEAHPLACTHLATCLEAAAERFEAPNRLPGPQLNRNGKLQPLGWSAAIPRLAAVIKAYRPEQIAFVLGEYPDHLSDLLQLVIPPGAQLVRFSGESLIDGRITLQDASLRLFGRAHLPFFDCGRSDLVFAFGVTGEEPWLRSPGLGVQVHFGPLPPTIDRAEWIQTQPGSEAVTAQAIARCLAVQNGLVDGDAVLDLPEFRQQSDLNIEKLQQLAQRFAAARAAVAVPGAMALSQAGGPETARQILAINALGLHMGRPGGMFLPLDPPLYSEHLSRTSTLAEARALLERIHAGQVKVVMVHGVDPLAVLPAVFDARAAFEKLDFLISFDPHINELSSVASLLLPDHLPLESWGYHKSAIGADRPVVSAIQPLAAPLRDTRSTVNVLLTAAGLAGGGWSAPFQSEAAFLHRTVKHLQWSTGTDPFRRWSLQGGWWPAGTQLLPPVGLMSVVQMLRSAHAEGEPVNPDRLRLVWTSAQQVGSTGGIPVAKLNPQTLDRLHLRPGGTARIETSSSGLDVRLSEDPAQLPGIVALAASPKARVELFGGENACGDWAANGVMISLHERV